jgi:hypothetical protein
MEKHSVFRDGENVFALKNGEDDAGTLKLTFSGEGDVSGTMVNVAGEEETGYVGEFYSDMPDGGAANPM